MQYRLAPHVSFCRPADDIVFLDRRADRYWCLEGALARAFALFADGGTPPAESEPALRSLVAAGILTLDDGDEIAPCAAMTVPRESLLDGPNCRASALSCVRAMVRTERARLSLHAVGLHRTLARLEQRKRNMVASGVDAAGIVAAYTRPGWFRAAEGECLRRSIGLMGALTRARISATMVIGVKLRPFAAHCWVQTDDLLLNERHDRVRDFTPILIL